MNLIRLFRRGDSTIGILTFTGGWCYTLEETAAIFADGVYKTKSYIGKRPYAVPMLEDVPGRTAIEIHIGNTTDDTEGCVLVGTSTGTLSDRPAVMNSTTAFKNMMKGYANDDIHVFTVSPLLAVSAGLVGVGLVALILGKGGLK